MEAEIRKSSELGLEWVSEVRKYNECCLLILAYKDYIYKINFKAMKLTIYVKCEEWHISVIWAQSRKK